MPTGQLSSQRWFIRITADEKHIVNRMLEWTHSIHGSTIQRQLMVSHIGMKTEKYHVHMLVELKTILQKQSVDKTFKKMFEVSGADYSSKVWDGEMGAGAGSYLFHDPQHRIILNVGFTDAEIDHFKQINEEVQKVIVINKQRASGRAVERILNQIVDSQINWTREQICMVLLKDIKEGSMYEPGDFVLRRFIEEIYGKQFTGDNWDKYAKLRCSNLVRQEDPEIYFPK